MTMPNRCPINFADPAVELCPFPAYHQLRPSQPVYKDPATGFYFILDYSLLRRVALDCERFSNNTGVIQVRSGELGDRLRALQRERGVELVPVLLTTDPPQHAFFRAFVEAALGTNRVQKLEDFLTQIVDEMIGTAADEGALEFVGEICTQVPVSVLVDLLGVDRSYRGEIKRWSDAAAASADPSLSPEIIFALMEQVCEFQRFIATQAAKYRAAPQDCLLSQIANGEVGGRRLTESELVSLVQQIMVAGHETTTNVMASAMLQIIRTPGLEQTLREDPTLIPNFVEEVLRLESPLQGMFRLTTVDVKLGGIEIPKGSVVVVRWGAGNRDPRRFENPDALDIHRPNGAQHLAFGMGRHFCVGNRLARAELRITFDRLLRRLKNFTLADTADAVVRTPHYFTYGIRELRITFDKIH